ncbi:MAG: type II/IV secretion system protein [Deltaproteobacteria bacterium]|nr:MAG: type II/IV secretion system protein [Deltaproteobacteria bacterium]
MPNLVEILSRAGVADRTTIERVAREVEGSTVSLGEALVHETGVDERDVYVALAEAFGLELASADDLVDRIDAAVVEAVPRRFEDREFVLPLYREGDTLVVATANLDANVEPLAASVPGTQRVRRLLITPSDYRQLRAEIDLRRLQRRARSTEPGQHDELEDLFAPGTDAEMVRLFYALLVDAISEGASDLHFERYGDRVRIRHRVDGDLHDASHYTLSPDQLIGVINVLKVHARLDLAERRRPQGGRARVRVGGRTFDLRVQTQPALHGEHAVIRLLAEDRRLLPSTELGFPEELVRRYERYLDSPQGLLLVVGPTGSGKTTTVYAALQRLARDVRRKVITVEDPIEYAIDGIQQTQVHPELGLTFAQSMRVFVRQDPDVIFVGEIRDGETALEALRASQTGHLVLSTLHCNDAADAVQRLLDLGMHPNSIAAELLVIFAQRLAKRICTRCRIPDDPDPETVREIFPEGLPQGLKPMRGKGCVRCNGTGTRGRIAAVEMLPASPALRRAIAHRVPLDDLRQVARDNGLVPLRQGFLRLVREGIVSLEEMRRHLSLEQLAPAHRDAV